MLNLKNKILLSVAPLSILLSSAHAQDTSVLSKTKSLVLASADIVAAISGLMFGIAFVVFVFVVINYVYRRRSGDSNGLKEAGNTLWWSVFAMFVLMAVWGISYFLSQNLGIGLGGCIDKPSPIPGVPSQRVCTGTGNSNTGVGDVFDGAGKLQGCYQYNNATCSAHPECKIDSVEQSCVPR
jgi:hypothetical protein